MPSRVWHWKSIFSWILPTTRTELRWRSYNHIGRQQLNTWSLPASIWNHLHFTYLNWIGISSLDYRVKSKQLPILQKHIEFNYNCTLNRIAERVELRESYRNCIENNLTFDNYLNFLLLFSLSPVRSHSPPDNGMCSCTQREPWCIHIIIIKSHQISIVASLSAMLCAQLFPLVTGWLDAFMGHVTSQQRARITSSATTVDKTSRFSVQFSLQFVSYFECNFAISFIAHCTAIESREQRRREPVSQFSPPI